METHLQEDEHYDIVIVGGGVYGAAFCLLAANNGYKVALYEKNDFASGASLYSLKIIHGGIRYLQSLNLKRTLKSIAARNRFVTWFSHGVKPIKCVLPLKWLSAKNPLMVFAGFTFYSLLSRFSGAVGAAYSGAGLMSGAAKVSSLITYSDTPALGYWHDAQAQNPERMVIDMITTAQARGAKVHSYAEVKSVEKLEAGGLKVGVQPVNGEQKSVQARMVVDCSSGWNSFGSQFPQLETVYVRAINLVVEGDFGDIATTITSPIEPSRMLFICPWQGKTLLGTWYWPMSQSQQPLSLELGELRGMLDEINQFSDTKISFDHVTSVHLGLLPLGPHADPSKDLGNGLAAETFCVESPNTKNLFRLEGIKFTTAVADSMAVFSDLIASSGLTLKARQFSENEINSTVADISVFSEKMVARYSWVEPLTLQRLIRLYGAQAEQILLLADKDSSLNMGIEGIAHSLVAELVHVMKNEMAEHAVDVLVRRVGVGVLAQPSSETVSQVVEFMAQQKGWSSQRKELETSLVQQEFSRFNLTEVVVNE